jgi:hypothetical protein
VLAISKRPSASPFQAYHRAVNVQDLSHSNPRAGKHSPSGGKCAPAAAAGSSRHSDSATYARKSTSIQHTRDGGASKQEERAKKKIALFRSLFRGREDAYAQRWQRADGRSGYAPAAIKDWKAINKSHLEDRKKVDQKTRIFFDRVLPAVTARKLGCLILTL